MQKQRVIPGRDSQDLSQFINKMSIGKPYEVINFKETRNLDVSGMTLANLANIVGTLIQDLKNKGIIQEK